ncbi:unnamed protein product, partial [Amoebophrya sp. A120]|eukprot:GSA120T00019496001.1
MSPVFSGLYFFVFCTALLCGNYAPTSVLALQSISVAAPDAGQHVANARLLPAGAEDHGKNHTIKSRRRHFMEQIYGFFSFLHGDSSGSTDGEGEEVQDYFWVGEVDLYSTTGVTEAKDSKNSARPKNELLDIAAEILDSEEEGKFFFDLFPEELWVLEPVEENTDPQVFVSSSAIDPEDAPAAAIGPVAAPVGALRANQNYPDAHAYVGATGGHQVRSANLDSTTSPAVDSDAGGGAALSLAGDEQAEALLPGIATASEPGSNTHQLPPATPGPAT